MSVSAFISFLSFERSELDGKYSLIGCSSYARMYACWVMVCIGYSFLGMECQLVLIALQH